MRLWTIEGGPLEAQHGGGSAGRLGEEAVETVIEAIKGRKGHLIEESADLLYFLLVIWKDQGIEPNEVWNELHKRHKLPEAEERAGRLK